MLVPMYSKTESIIFAPCFFKAILILFQLRLCLPTGLLPILFPTDTLYALCAC